MPTVLHCKACGRLAYVPDHMAGQTVRCLACKSEMHVPLLGEGHDEAPGPRHTSSGVRCAGCSKSFDPAELTVWGQALLCRDCHLEAAATDHRTSHHEHTHHRPSRRSRVMAVVGMLLVVWGGAWLILHRPSPQGATAQEMPTLPPVTPQPVVAPFIPAMHSPLKSASSQRAKLFDPLSPAELSDKPAGAVPPKKLDPPPAGPQSTGQDAKSDPSQKSIFDF